MANRLYQVHGYELVRFKHRKLHFARMVKPGLGFSESDPEILHLSGLGPVATASQISSSGTKPELDTCLPLLQTKFQTMHPHLNPKVPQNDPEIRAASSCGVDDKSPPQNRKMEPNLSEIDSGNVKVSCLFFLLPEGELSEILPMVKILQSSESKNPSR
ncbi:hypothetical protein VNO77_20288 [Canavalia gladiata]|uniref:Uncharacterized protein n=1 Tax=Canavalia gladiata TaxID=3824 RepID=A0AAN9LNY2_CANGL